MEQGSYNSYMALKSGTCFELGTTLMDGWGVKTHLVDIAKVDDGEVFDSVSYLVEDFILQHAVLGIVRL